MIEATTPSEVCEVINLLRLQSSDDLTKMRNHADVMLGRSMYHKRDSEADMHNLTSLLCQRELSRRKGIK